MPVFTAFGWAGEEAAISFALNQLEEFVTRLHANLPRDIQTRFPFSGLDRAGELVYLGASTQTESAPYIAIYARPMSMELQLVITDSMALSTAWKAATNDPDRLHQLLYDLGFGWSLRVPQMQVDPDSEERTFYQDLFKDELEKLNPETLREVAERASFLNSEPQWVVPFYLSLRIPSEQVAAMGVKIVGVTTDWLRNLMPVVDFLTRRDAAATRRKRPKVATMAAKPAEKVEEPPAKERFVYTAKLKPLHIRRGFVNLTPHHWPFFAENARSTTRPVTIIYEGHYDKESAVWRLSHNDQARVVLGPAVREWLADNFDADDKIQVIASKRDDDKIEVRLEAAE